MIFSKSKSLEAAMEQADSYEEWKAAAIAHDKLSGLHKWQTEDESRHFDYASIRRRLERLRKLQAEKDYPGILFALNEGVHGNIDGMGRARLYNKTRFGTKQLIVEYTEEVAKALKLLASEEARGVARDELLDFFERAEHCYGASALMMSGAGSLLFFHVGVLKALWQEDLLPDILSGSSGGAIVGTLASTHLDDELDDIFSPDNLVEEIERDEGLLRYLNAFKPEVARVEDVHTALKRLIPDLTFLEAYEKTGRHLNISIAAAERHQTSRLLNAITTPNVYIREAVMASAAVPGFFPPVALAAKNSQGERQAYMPSRKWVDGSISDDLPAKRLARLYGANHFIVSQVNPHIFPFVNETAEESGSIAPLTRAARRSAREWINAGATLLQKPLAWSSRINRVSSVALGIINQDYVGDINILPKRQFFNPLKLLGHRSIEEVNELIGMGERATWPKIEMIRTQTRVGRVLRRIIHDVVHQDPVRAERRTG